VRQQHAELRSQQLLIDLHNLGNREPATPGQLASRREWMALTMLVLPRLLVATPCSARSHS
jgi:hypothetical protein